MFPVANIGFQVAFASFYTSWIIKTKNKLHFPAYFLITSQDSGRGVSVFTEFAHFKNFKCNFEVKTGKS